MLTIINFSHPLSAEAEAALPEHLGVEAVRVHIVPVQVDLAAELQSQVNELVAVAVAAAGGNRLNIDCIIPPGHAAVAAMLARELPHANLLVLRAVGTPPRYRPAQLVYARGGGRVFPEP